MSVNNSEIEKKIYKYKQNINNDDNKSSIVNEIIKKNNIWTQKIPRRFNKIIYDINKYINSIKKSNSLLELDNEKRRNRNKINKNEIKKYNSEIKVIKEKEPKPSKKCTKYIKNINEKIKEMKNLKKEIELKDTKSLKSISLNIYKIPKFILKLNKEKEKKMRPTSASTHYESKMFEFNTKNKTSRNRKLKHNQLSFKSSKEKVNFQNTNDLRMINFNKKIEENEKKGNLGRLNDMYRMKINRVLNIYTPIRHLKEMKDAQIEDINMRKNINNINEKIKKRIKERCEGFYFKKQYDKYLLKNKTNYINEKKTESESYKNNNSKRELSSALKRKSYSTKNLIKQKIIPVKLTDKENYKTKKENYKNILDLIKNSLDIESINEYINEKVTNRVIYYPYELKDKIDKNKSLKEDEKKYFSKYAIINNKFRELIGYNKDIFDVDKNMNNIFRTKELISKELAKNSSYKHYSDI